MPALFDVVGNVKDPSGFAKLLGSLGKNIAEVTERKISNRFALERYLRGAEQALTKHLADGLAEAYDISGMPLIILLDTYEELTGYDDWVCRSLVGTIPSGVKIVVLGRNALANANFDWLEYGDVVHSMEPPELEEGDAKAYPAQFGFAIMCGRIRFSNLPAVIPCYWYWRGIWPERREDGIKLARWKARPTGVT